MKKTPLSELFPRIVTPFSMQFQIGTRVYEASVVDAVAFARNILKAAQELEEEENEDGGEKARTALAAAPEGKV